jgi:hypothetical protein
MKFIVFPPPVILAYEHLDATPRGLDSVGVVPSVRMDEVNAVVYGAVRITL